MTDIVQLLERWQLDVGDLRERMYRAPTPRERERWHGLWLLAQGWSPTRVAEALERESLIPSETGWTTFAKAGPKVWSLSRLGVPPVLNRGQQNQLKSAVQNPPGEAGIELSNWNWKVVSRDSPDQTTFPGYSSRGDTAKYNPAFQERQMRPDSLKFHAFIGQPLYCQA